MSKKSIDIIGKSFNRLTAVNFSHKDNHNKQYWVFLCSCGKTKAMRKDKVISGLIKSCGCLIKERSYNHANGRYKRGRTYLIWSQVKSRVKRPPGRCYIGITLSDEWKLFTNFLRDMGEVPEGKTIDRIDNNKGYCAENCRWATRLEQARNRRKRFNAKTSSKYKGVSFIKCSSMWSSEITVDYKRIRLGTFENEADAAISYNEAAKKHFGEFACLNIVA